MPKPVKKAAKKPAARKRPSSDPNVRAGQIMAAHIDKLAAGKWAGETPEPASEPPTADASFEAQFRARMAELGRKGGKVSGAKRMEMPEAKRKAIAKKAARARWGKKEPAES
jgi:general stress protein YciG